MIESTLIFLISAWKASLVCHSITNHCDEPLTHPLCHARHSCLILPKHTSLNSNGTELILHAYLFVCLFDSRTANTHGNFRTTVVILCTRRFANGFRMAVLLHDKEDSTSWRVRLKRYWERQTKERGGRQCVRPGTPGGYYRRARTKVIIAPDLQEHNKFPSAHPARGAQN